MCVHAAYMHTAVCLRPQQEPGPTSPKISCHRLTETCLGIDVSLVPRRAPCGRRWRRGRRRRGSSATSPSIRIQFCFSLQCSDSLQRVPCGVPPPPASAPAMVRRSRNAPSKTGLMWSAGSTFDRRKGWRSNSSSLPACSTLPGAWRNHSCRRLDPRASSWTAVAAVRRYRPRRRPAAAAIGTQTLPRQRRGDVRC